MSTDPQKTLNGTRQPFRREVVWGKPPETVFRAGPLPKGERLPPLPQPPRAAGAGILSGSMIPTAPVAGPRLEPAVEPAPVARAPEPDLTVRPLPSPAPEPVEPPAAMPPAKPPVLAEAVPEVLPAATVRAPTRKAASRVPLYAGIAVAAVTVIALGGWIWTRTPAAPPAPVPAAGIAPPLAATPLTPPVAVVEAPVMETEAPPEPATASPAPSNPVAAAPTPTATPTPTPARTPDAAVVRPAPPQRDVVVPPPVVAPVPLIEIAPAQPAGPPPTEAEAPPSDPNAPIVTRPQPIG